jgi:hypothetical protein
MTEIIQSNITRFGSKFLFPDESVWKLIRLWINFFAAMGLCPKRPF